MSDFDVVTWFVNVFVKKKMIVQTNTEHLVRTSQDLENNQIGLPENTTPLNPMGLLTLALEGVH